MLTLMASLFGFLAILLGALGVLQLRLERAPADRRARSLRAPARPSGEPVILRQFSSIPALRSFLTNSSWAERARRDLERADLNLKVGEYLLIRFLVAVLLLLAGLLLVGFQAAGLLLGLPLAALGFVLPAFYLGVRKGRRLRAMEGQLVETLALLSNSIRSGFGFLQGIQAAANQLPPPISDELHRVIQDTNVGVSTEQALLDLGQRVGSYDLDMVITAIVIQRSTGGNLSEILDNVAETIRERERVQGEQRTVSALVRYIIAVLGQLRANIGNCLPSRRKTLHVFVGRCSFLSNAGTGAGDGDRTQPGGRGGDRSCGGDGLGPIHSRSLCRPPQRLLARIVASAAE